MREKRPITTHAHVNKLVDDQIVKKKEMTFLYFFLLHFLFDKQKVEDPISRPYTHTPSFDVKKKKKYKESTGLFTSSCIYEFNRNTIICSFDLTKHHKTYDFIEWLISSLSLSDIMCSISTSCFYILIYRKIEELISRCLFTII